MSKKPVFTSHFKKDYKKILKQGKDESKFEALIAKLINNEILEDKYKDHKLSGQFKNCRECHIEPDWLVIYKITDLEIILIRTGSHSELFR
ncbi:type II toxin-antitoxin system YafQ family toxin [bacterium]|nr:type II toxin-antitoxin system YafQ family toxin [bacterium]